MGSYLADRAGRLTIRPNGSGKIRFVRGGRLVTGELFSRPAGRLATSTQRVRQNKIWARKAIGQWGAI